MFNGIWLDASEPLTIQGREVRAGERFHLSRVHAGALLVTGRATIVHPQPPPKARVGAIVFQAAPPITTAPRRRGRAPKNNALTDLATSLASGVVKEHVTTEVKTGIAPTAPADPPTVPEAPAHNLDSGLEIEIHDNIIEGNEAAAIEKTPRRYHRRDLEAE